MPDTYNPLVSIVIPVYNGSNYLAQAIDSALAQTYKNIEVIVVNDGSNDKGKTRKIALSYGHKIRYFEKENGGVATALNLGIQEMRGEYFSWLSHDDAYCPNKIESEINVAKIFDEPVVIYCNVSIISKSHPIVHNKISIHARRSMQCFLAFDVVTGLNGCSLLIPKILFERYGLFDPLLQYTQDYDLWFRFAKHLPFVGVEENLVLSRSHNEQGCKKNPIECTKAADDLHAYMVKSLPESELKDFICEDFNYVLHSYRTHKNAGYFKTAMKMLSIIMNNVKSSDLKRLKIEIVEDLLQWSGQSLSELLSDDGNHEGIRRKKLLIYSNIFGVGGIERVISIVTESLKENYEVYLVSGESERSEAFILPKEVRHIKIHNGDFGTLPGRLVLLCIALEIDLFIGCPNLVERFLDIYPMFKEAGIKTIAWNHNSYFLPLETNYLIPVAHKRNRIYEYASVVTWSNSFSYGVYSGINLNGALMSNPNTFTEEPDEDDLAASKDKIVLCIGRLYDSVKRVDLMLRVFHQVLILVPDAKLYLVGAYDLNMRIPADSKYTLKELLRHLCLDNDRVVFVGQTRNIRDYYKEASVLLLTSDSEGFGMVLNEAAHMGIPSFIFEIPGLEDIITHDKNGYIIPRNDIDEMAKRIAAVLSDDNLRLELGKNAQEMSRRFSRDIIGQRWIDLIETILACNNQAELNGLILKKFAVTIEDRQLFLRQLILCYERIAVGLAREFAKAIALSVPPLPSDCNVSGIRQRLKKYGIVRFAYYRLYKPHVRPFLKKVKRAAVYSAGIGLCFPKSIVIFFRANL